MTQDEIIKISRLQNQGIGYKRISVLTGIPVNTVKSYCRRHPTGEFGCCLQCGVPIKQTPHKRAKKFCSDACRMAWWKAHPKQVQRKLYHLTCTWCGQPFDSLGDGKRQYCSRACYLARYNGYVERYNAAKEKVEALEQERTLRLARVDFFDAFIHTVKGMNAVPDKFSDKLWLKTVDTVTVKPDGTMVFRFQNGMEIEG